MIISRPKATTNFHSCLFAVHGCLGHCSTWGGCRAAASAHADALKWKKSQQQDPLVPVLNCFQPQTSFVSQGGGCVHTQALLNDPSMQGSPLVSNIASPSPFFHQHWEKTYVRWANKQRNKWLARHMDTHRQMDRSDLSGIRLALTSPCICTSFKTRNTHLMGSLKPSKVLRDLGRTEPHDSLLDGWQALAVQMHGHYQRGKKFSPSCLRAL